MPIELLDIGIYWILSLNLEFDLILGLSYRVYTVSIKGCFQIFNSKRFCDVLSIKYPN